MGVYGPDGIVESGIGSFRRRRELQNWEEPNDRVVTVGGQSETGFEATIEYESTGDVYRGTFDLEWKSYGKGVLTSA